MKLMINWPCAILILLTSLLLVHHPAGAQETTKKKQFRLIKAPNSYYSTHVEFIDTITNQVKHTFDLKQNNPYNKLNLSSCKQKRISNRNWKNNGNSFCKNKNFFFMLKN